MDGAGQQPQQQQVSSSYQLMCLTPTAAGDWRISAGQTIDQRAQLHLWGGSLIQFEKRKTKKMSLHSKK
jgi:hypothetical protein